jgi:hypothetical protein
MCFGCRYALEWSWELRSDEIMFEFTYGRKGNIENDKDCVSFADNSKNWLIGKILSREN